jgi:hypothetical protein
MSVTIEQAASQPPESVLADLARRYVFVTTLDVEPVENDPHWHGFDSEFVIVSGDLTLTDVENEIKLSCGPGKRG